MDHDFRTLDLQALLSFHTVARLDGISKAAAHLGMAKSGVSRHVSQLEDRLGAKLLERGSRSVRLTPLGRRLDERVRSILAEVDLLSEIAREERLGISGQVTIAATPEFGGLVAARVFPKLLAQHPGLRLVMRPSYEFEDMQDPGTDLTFRVGNFADDRLVSKPLGSFYRWLVATPDLAARFPLGTPTDLERTPCLTFRSDRPAATWHFEGPDGQCSVDVAGPVAARSFSILLGVARSGMGYGFLPDFMVRELVKSGELIHCLPEFTSTETPVFLNFRPGMRRIAKVNAVIDAAEALVTALLDP